MRALRSFALFAALAVLLWQLAITLFDVPPYLMPGPLATGRALLRHAALLGANLAFTVGEALVGLVLSTLLAIAVGGIFVASPLTAHAVFPFAIALRSIPVVAVAPIVTLIVGRGFWTGVSVVVLAAFFPILVNALRGFLSVRPAHLELMHLYAASRTRTFFAVRLPFALSYVFAGLRTAAPIAVLGAMLSEWLTGNRGLGYLILDSAALRELELLWAAITVSMLLGLSIFWATAAAQRMVVRWR